MKIHREPSGNQTWQWKSPINGGFSTGKSLINGPFSVAMFDCQRVNDKCIRTNGLLSILCCKYGKEGKKGFEYIKSQVGLIIPLLDKGISESSGVTVFKSGK